MASKSIEVMQYTETVYWDDNGNEVARVRNYDDTWYDTREDGLPVSEEELDDHFTREKELPF